MLFNRFKNILDAYNETFQSNVMIYARINDKSMNNPMLFSQEINNRRILNIDQSKCSKLGKSSTIEVKFNEVFDSINFKDNITISKYMTLSSQITKGKGIVFITYGYSGTGKTFTLFGKKDKQGLLQATLLNIVNVKKILFRVYEIYGRGLPYNQYWDNPEKIDQYLIKYKLRVDTKYDNTGKPIRNLRTVCNPFIMKGTDAIKSFIDRNSDDDFIELSNNDADTKNIFSNFSAFIDEIDAHRKEGKYSKEDTIGGGCIEEREYSFKRIVQTPNNTESSRSIIIYEFYIQVENTIIPFILIDLPGREDIIGTYVTSIISDKKISLIEKSVLNSIVINPFSYSLKPKVSNELNRYIMEGDFYKLQNILIQVYKSKLESSLNIYEKCPEYFNNIFEGIYINENIMSLIKNLIDINSEKTGKEQIKLNDQQIDIERIKIDIDMIYNNYKDSKSDNVDNLYTTVIDYNKNIYSSQKIFNQNKDTHILDTLMKKYSKDRIYTEKDNSKAELKIKNIPIKSVDSYKLLYLFTNDDNQQKCEFQYELFDNTRSLIDNIRN